MPTLLCVERIQADALRHDDVIVEPDPAMPGAVVRRRVRNVSIRGGRVLVRTGAVGREELRTYLPEDDVTVQRPATRLRRRAGPAGHPD